MSEINEETNVHKFLQYFNSLERKSCPLVPDWSSFNPMDVAHILPWIAVIERKNETLSGHKYRLIGEGLIKLMGKNYRNYDLEQVLTSEKNNIHWENINTVVKCRTPSFIKSTIPVKGRDFNQILRGCFPFCDDTKKIRRLIIVVEVLSVQD